MVKRKKNLTRKHSCSLQFAKIAHFFEKKPSLQKYIRENYISDGYIQFKQVFQTVCNFLSFISSKFMFFSFPSFSEEMFLKWQFSMNWFEPTLLLSEEQGWDCCRYFSFSFFSLNFQLTPRLSLARMVTRTKSRRNC